jgi:phage-related minor tail protein
MYLYGFWGSTFFMLVLAFAVNQGGGLLGWAAGACTFKAVREAITLPGTFVLDRASKGIV